MIQEQEKNPENTNKDNALMPKRMLLGVTIIGWVNFAILGLLGLIAFAFTYFAIDGNAAYRDMIMKEIKNQYANVQINYNYIKVGIAVQMVLFVLNIISGLGILMRKEWARRMTIYCAFAIVFIIFLAVIAKASFINQAIIHIMYPGLLIIYFTNKDVEKYFNS